MTFQQHCTHVYISKFTHLWKLHHETYQCRMYSTEFLMMVVEDARNM